MPFTKSAWALIKRSARTEAGIIFIAFGFIALAFVILWVGGVLYSGTFDVIGLLQTNIVAVYLWPLLLIFVAFILIRIAIMQALKDEEATLGAKNADLQRLLESRDNSKYIARLDKLQNAYICSHGFIQISDWMIDLEKVVESINDKFLSAEDTDQIYGRRVVDSMSHRMEKYEKYTRLIWQEIERLCDNVVQPDASVEDHEVSSIIDSSEICNRYKTDAAKFAVRNQKWMRSVRRYIDNIREESRL